MLWENQQQRALSPQHEARWLNLCGFLLRPGFGAQLDDLRSVKIDIQVPDEATTFEPVRSGWLRKDLVARLRKETGLPVEHVIVAKNGAEVPA